MERFTHMSPEDTFGTTLKVCCCIKISGLKKGKNYWASIDASLFLFFFFFQHVLIFIVILNLHMSVKTVVKGDLKGVYTEKDTVRKANKDYGLYSSYLLNSL